jgi:hypothetical protein
MSKKSAGQIVLDKIDAEIRQLTLVRERLIDAIEVKPKRERKPKQGAPAPPRFVTENS